MRNIQSTNPIIVVDDDKDDLEIIKIAYSELERPNELVLLSSADELEKFIKKSQSPPFVILCDYNLPRTNGLQLRQRLLEGEDTRYQSTPFILWSTAATESQIRKAYDLLIQGFFIKPNSMTEVKQTFEFIINYWSQSQHPKQLKKL